MCSIYLLHEPHLLYCYLMALKSETKNTNYRDSYASIFLFLLDLNILLDTLSDIKTKFDTQHNKV